MILYQKLLHQYHVIILFKVFHTWFIHCFLFFLKGFSKGIWRLGLVQLLIEATHCTLPCSHGSSIGWFYDSHFLVFVIEVYLILILLFFWLHSMSSMISKLFDQILLGQFGYSRFVLRGFSRVTVSISKILDLGLLNSICHGDLSFEVSGGLSLLSDFL